MTGSAFAVTLPVLWGNSGDGKTWHHLLAHLMDAASAAELVYDESFPPAFKRTLGVELGTHDAGALLAWIAGIHDVGKATVRIPEQAPSLSPPSTDPSMSGDRLGLGWSVRDRDLVTQRPPM